VHRTVWAAHGLCVPRSEEPYALRVARCAEPRCNPRIHTATVQHTGHRQAPYPMASCLMPHRSCDGQLVPTCVPCSFTFSSSLPNSQTLQACRRAATSTLTGSRTGRLNSSLVLGVNTGIFWLVCCHSRNTALSHHTLPMCVYHVEISQSTLSSRSMARHRRPWGGEVAMDCRPSPHTSDPQATVA
jgi:hypothetical protein